ncbi:unnamed protein product [Diatraea saccharalis]|uniref:Ionotropic receptor n=1 Tax=Diatraea saccharalis TaxID=40085 RepID=A0A9N9WBY5_9NEOP|nr:unnamed protein product [Diatraea saccharalis]
MFFMFWYYLCVNAIIIRYNDSIEKLMITYYSPYIYENYKLDHEFGCWTHKKITYPVENIHESFVCVKECNNLTLNSALKTNHLGTCIGLRTIIVDYEDKKLLKEIDVFEEKGKNLHGYPLTAFVLEIMPFLMIDENPDGTYTLRERDGRIWNTMAELMNFTIDISPCADFMKKPFNFELVIKLIFDYSMRKADLILMPVYQFNFLVVDFDMGVPYKESGVCFMAHRAGFETSLFDFKMVTANYELLLEALCCFVGTWFVFFIFNVVEKGIVSFDQVGKDLINAIRNVLSIPLYKPPKTGKFRFFLLMSIWSYFIINFAIQAVIISFYSVYKRGKDVDTFKDIVEKGYIIEGVPSPDVVLPETNDINIIINSRVVAVRNMFECVNKIANDRHRFCLNDCSVGRYLQRNLLNDKGEQYLHIAKDQIHNHLLTMLQYKNSPLTDHLKKHMLRIVQAGLIDKWEEYRFHDITDDVPVKSLSMDDLLGIFECYCVLLCVSIMTFLLEVTISNAKRMRRTLNIKYSQWHRARAVKKNIKIKKSINVKMVDSYTQTLADYL